MIGLCEALALNAARQPAKPALVAERGSWTYEALLAEVERLAGGIERADPGGERVALLLGNTPEHVIALLAVARLGRCAVVMDHRWARTELGAALERFAPSLLLVEDELAALAGRVVAETASSVQLVRTGPAFDALLAGPAYRGPLAPVDGRDLVISPTGGTTSTLKGAQLSERAVIMRFFVQAVEFGFNPRDVYLVTTPLFHGGARSFALSLLYLGGTVVLPRTVRLEELPEQIAQHGVTLTFLVPTMLGEVASVGRAFPAPFRLLIASGSRLDPRIRAEVLERVTPTLVNYFSSVEAGPISVLRPGDPADKLHTVGQVMWGPAIAMVDDALQPVPRGQLGRVLVRSQAAAHGYFRDPEASARTFVGDAVLTGDRASVDDDGYVVLAGRGTDMIISGGINIHPAEVEEAIMQDARIGAVAVLGLPHPRWGEAVTAVVVPRAGAAVSEAEVIAGVGQRLASYKKPKRVVFHAALPLTTSGKVARAELRRELAALYAEDAP